MKLVKESLNELNFERIKDPLGALGIGKRQLIRDWLDKYRITNYTINKDYTIDGDMIILEDIDLKQFPDYIQFNEVTAWFSVENCNLISLKGSPRKCGSFCCDRNKLTSLEYCPKMVERYFQCQYNSVKFSVKDVLKLCDAAAWFIEV
jgi:hypothetical protein